MRKPTVALPTPAAVEALEERSLLSAAPSSLLANVPPAAGYKLVYDLNVPLLGGDFTHNAVPYSTNNAASIGTKFDRIAYYMELTDAAGADEWIFVSAKAFTTNARMIGVPTVASGGFWQQKLSDLDVDSNVAGIVTGEDMTGGNIEFWPKSYRPANSANVPGASATAYDFGDTTIPGAVGTGSMQIHDYQSKQTLFAYNDWGGLHPNQPAEIGIGNSPTGATDWTNVNSAGNWTARRLQVLVHMTGATTTPVQPSPPPPPPVATTTQSLGKILALGDSITWGYTPNVTLSGGYRSRLYTDLTAAGDSFQYVGSVKDTYTPMLTAAHEDLHEGHGGYRVDQILGNLTGMVAGTNVSPNDGGHWLDGTADHPAVNPDIILLHIGTNDFLQGRTATATAATLDKLVNKLTTLRPNAKLFLSNIIPLADAKENAQVIAYNKLIQTEIVPKYQALGRHIMFVDQYKNFINPATGKVITSSFGDGVHPYRAGYDKIGDTWAAAILAMTRKK